jgi:alanine dehydrogenase
MLVSAPKEIKAHEYRIGLTGSVENSKDGHF